VTQVSGTYDGRAWATGRPGVGFSGSFSGTLTRWPTHAEIRAERDRRNAQVQAMAAQIQDSYQAMASRLIRLHHLPPGGFYGGVLHFDKSAFAEGYVLEIPFGPGEEFRFYFYTSGTSPTADRVWAAAGPARGRTIAPTQAPPALPRLAVQHAAELPPPEPATATAGALPVGTVYNEASRLIWLEKGIPQLPWADAQRHCGDLELGTLRDWRLPSPEELTLLFDAGRSNSTRFVWSSVASDAKKGAAVVWSLSSGGLLDRRMRELEPEKSFTICAHRAMGS
jgi:hypothetical protein